MANHHLYGVLMPQEDQEPPTMSNHNDHDHDPPPNSLSPPPPGEFNSRDELMGFLKNWGKQQGFAVVISRSRQNRLWIKCDRGGEYADKHLNDPENRKRKRKATRLTGCPFNVKASMKKDMIWRCHTENPNHNHGPSEDLSVHPSIRRMTEEQLTKVNEMADIGKTPIETLEELKRIWPDIQVLKRDIYNARKKYKTEKELREVEEGLHLPTTYEDPNGKMPGPSRTGRWEWLEDGDEIKRKKRRMRPSILVDSSTPVLDSQESESPQMTPLTLASQHQQQQRSAPVMPAMGNPYPTGLSPQPSNNSDFGSNFGVIPQNPRQFRHYQAPGHQMMTRRDFNMPSNNTNTDPMLQSTIPPRGRQPDISSMTPMITPIVPSATPAAPIQLSSQAQAKPQQSGGQVLISRIERMEKEQTEQKNMLAAILSAVQSSGGGAVRR